MIFFGITILLLVFIFIVIRPDKPPIKEVIEQSISPNQETTLNENNNKAELNEEDDEQQNDQQEKLTSEPISGKIIDSVHEAIDFIFPQQINIVAIGDSLTQGVGDHTKNGGYVGILDQIINHDLEVVTFTNFGKAGYRTDQLLTYLDDKEVAAKIRHADLIIITIGANDIMQVVKENFTDLTYDLFVTERVYYERRLDEIMRKIIDLNEDVEVYLLGIYNPFTRYFYDIEELNRIVDDWNQTSETITSQYEHVTFVPIIDIFANPNINLFADDNFHPNYRGYHRIAERILEYILTEGD